MTSSNHDMSQVGFYSWNMKEMRYEENIAVGIFYFYGIRYNLKLTIAKITDTSVKTTGSSSSHFALFYWLYERENLFLLWGNTITLGRKETPVIKLQNEYAIMQPWQMWNSVIKDMHVERSGIILDNSQINMQCEINHAFITPIRQELEQNTAIYLVWEIRLVLCPNVFFYICIWQKDEYIKIWVYMINYDWIIS